MIPTELSSFKKIGRPINILTAWDSISASIVEEAGADVVLVGDSLAMVVLGHATTLPVTLDEMLHHTKAVGRGFVYPPEKQPLLVCDLPFLSYQCGEDNAVAAAGKLLKHSSASAVKIEGAEPEVLKVIERLVRMGIPVMGHIGLTPQSVHQLGYRRQGEDETGQDKIFNQAIEIEKAGCFAIVIEHVPAELTGRIRNKLTIPTIGIGAGENCDGQVRVTADLLGFSTKQPPFAKSLINGKKLCINALKDWLEQQHDQGENPTTTSSQ